MCVSRSKCILIVNAEPIWYSNDVFATHFTQNINYSEYKINKVMIDRWIIKNVPFVFVKISNIYCNTAESSSSFLANEIILRPWRFQSIADDQLYRRRFMQQRDDEFVTCLAACVAGTGHAQRTCDMPRCVCGRNSSRSANLRHASLRVWQEQHTLSKFTTCLAACVAGAAHAQRVIKYNKPKNNNKRN